MIQAEAFGLSLQNDSITDALRTKEWGILVTHSSDDGKTKASFILDADDALKLIGDLEKAFFSVGKIGGRIASRADSQT